MGAKRKSEGSPSADPTKVGTARRAELLAQAQQYERAIKRLIAAKKSRDSLVEFTRFTMPHPEDVDDTDRSLYEPAWFHNALDELALKIAKGEILRAIVTMPPRHGKSELKSRRLPPWVVGRAPYSQVIFATYAQDFADDFGRKWREVIDMPQYREVFPGVQLKKTSRASDRMETLHGGMMVALGVGGPATGRGADFLIIDDPFKNREEAESLTHRDKVWNWFTSVAYTRLMPNARVVIICTRWHLDDIVGRIDNPDYVKPEEAKKWYRLDLPAIIDENTESERALWPERYPLEVLKTTRDFIGPRDWASLYQQKPTPPEGVLIKNDMLFTYNAQQMPRNFRKYLAGDLALGDKKHNDHSCVGPFMVDEHDNIFIHPDLYWDKRLADASVERIVSMMEDHDPMDTFWEKGQIDKAVGPFLNKRIQERAQETGRYYGVTALPVKGDKGYRASAIMGRMRQGKVFFPAFAPWWPKAKDQLLKFTGSGDDLEDDFVDFISIIGQAMAKQMKGVRPPEFRKVVEFGSYRWLRQQTEYQEREKKIIEAKAGW